ncbi:MAG TPA: LuxR C-terminal-related transcriptional regulator [Gemmatimonadaceae bacterium]|nr:LuxR C-terminal-related transcriptional regulator [Gemmatimonadaceae bacterium]
MTTAGELERGRESFARQAWGDAYARLSAADAESPLALPDLERLATAAYLVGRDIESARLWTRAHRECLREHDVERAARCAFWLAHGLLDRGDLARGGAWVARARRLLDDAGSDCVERGYLRSLDAFRCIVDGDHAGAAAAFGEAAEIGRRFADQDLLALARHGRGRALIRLGESSAGVALLDDSMVAIEAGEVSPVVTGDVYCGVISGCLEIFDLRRAREWTTALTRWCAAQPDLVPYSGECLVRRAEVLLLHGAWPDAAEAARQAVERCGQSPDLSPPGSAFYQLGELHRLRGELAEAEAAYRQASRWGRTPLPGLAQLRLAQGQVDAAVTAIRRALDEAAERRHRCRLLPAHVEIMLAARELPAAHAAADELAAAAADVGASFLHAVAAHARGAVLLAAGETGDAVAALREAWSRWQELEAPYEAARVRTLLGRACRTLGDEESALLELDAAHWAFQRLGAAPDLAAVEALARPRPPRAAGALTARELQVLRRLATGETNRAIAAELRISEKTVARHVSNIFLKLELSTRAAATAYAYRHGLV